MTDDATEITSGRLIAAQKVNGTAVFNLSGEKLGSIDDIMKEAGFPNFEVTNWYGIFVPAKTPKPLIQRLNAELNKVLSSPQVAGKLAELGSPSVHGSSEAFAKFIAAEVPYWESAVKRSNAKVD